MAAAAATWKLLNSQYLMMLCLYVKRGIPDSHRRNAAAIGYLIWISQRSRVSCLNSSTTSVVIVLHLCPWSSRSTWSSVCRSTTLWSVCRGTSMLLSTPTNQSKTLEMHSKAHRVARLAQMCPQNSGVSGPKFTKFLSDVEESLAILTHASTLRSSHPLWNASAQNEGGLCQLLPICAKNRLPYQCPMSDHEQKVGLIISTLCTLVKISPVHSEITDLQGTVIKQSNIGTSYRS